MKRYPKYKESGIEWIGEIPEGWEIKPLKHVADIVLGKMLTPEDKGGYLLKPYLRAQNITWEHVDATDIKEMWFSKQELKQYRIKKNELLISEGGEVGRTAIWNDGMDECYIQNSVHKVTINPPSNPKYYLYHSEAYGKGGYYDTQVNRVSIGHLTREKLKDIRFLFPLKDEQTSIAFYLDRKTRQIDTLIAKKQRMIELLKEYRTAVITHAVTKGLNPNVKMKDSGIEWLGEIPEHWEVKRVKHATNKVGSGVTPRGGEEVYQEFGIPLLRSQNVHFDGLRLNDVAYISDEIHESMKNSKVLPGDVLLNITGASLGRCSYVSNEFGDANVNQHVCIVRPDKNVLTEYLFNLFASVIGQFQIFSNQVGTSREGASCKIQIM